MNLINDPWIPVRRSDNTHELIAPYQLTETDNPVIAVDAPRPDFNGALMQFLIGFLQTTATPETQSKWLDWLEEPPPPNKLRDQFSPYMRAFDLDSAEGSFMQDFEALDDSSFKSISELLIESPGDQTIKQNKDHFIKRGQVKAMCSCCTATALFTLQINAPGGGQGHRTSLRGGGPLSTLVVLDQQSDLPQDLWHNLWLNILNHQQLDTLTGETRKSAMSDIFPWLTKTRTSEPNNGKETSPLDAHPLQMYWSMPRRIRVRWGSEQSGYCDVCSIYSERLVTQYQTKNYGINYTGAWQHPMSPYSLNKKGELLPQHPQPGGITYQHWLGFVEDTETHFCALVVKHYRSLAESWGEQMRLHVFGYDMDNMKARCWYESTFPLFIIPHSIRLEFAKRVQSLTDSANEFAGFVRSCVKEAWFKRPGDAKGDTSFLTRSFIQQTEPAFFESARLLQQKLRDGTDVEIMNSWHQILFKTSLALFDFWAIRGDIAQANPRRVAKARDKLKKLAYSKKIKEALQLPQYGKSNKPKKETV